MGGQNIYRSSEVYTTHDHVNDHDRYHLHRKQRSDVRVVSVRLSGFFGGNIVGIDLLVQVALVLTTNATTHFMLA